MRPSPPYRRDADTGQGDRLRQRYRGRFGVVADTYSPLDPAKKHAEFIYRFFNEIQVISGWKPFVGRLTRTGRFDGIA